MPISNRPFPTAVLSIIFFVAAAYVAIFCLAPSPAFASTNILHSATTSFAWSDTIGWIDFYNQGNSSTTVTSSTITGSNVSSTVGIISLDCGTAIWGCGTERYGVTNDGAGNLGGYAWNNSIGWISFFWGNAAASSSQAKTTLCNGYGLYCGVTIDSSGNFHGFAWNDTIGWISFNCADLLVCGTAPYAVVTSWTRSAMVGTLDSTTFDTSSTGAQLNSVIWQGSLNGLPGQDVGFQFAASTSTSGPWTFTGPLGTTSTSDVYYASGPGIPIPIMRYSAYSGFRYFRYRIILSSDSAQTLSPQVNNVSVDWSP